MRKEAEEAILLMHMLSQTSQHLNFLTQMVTSKQPGNVNFGKEYQHLFVTNKHVETYFKSESKSQIDTSIVCQRSDLLGSPAGSISLLDWSIAGFLSSLKF